MSYGVHHQLLVYHRGHHRRPGGGGRGHLSLLRSVREWLLWAVTEAEKELGGGTGKLKLRQVYDLFVTRFPWLAKIVSFELFSDMVDDALDEMREMLQNNKAVQQLVEGGAEA